MNDNHSLNEWIYKPRWLSPLLREAVSVHPVVVLTGARQVGKSTFLREYPEARAGLLIHAGTEIRRLDEKIIALPWQWLAD